MLLLSIASDQQKYQQVWCVQHTRRHPAGLWNAKVTLTEFSPYTPKQLICFSVTPDKHMHTLVHMRARLLLEGWCFACVWLVGAASPIFWWLADLTCMEFPAEQAVLLLYFRPAPPASPLFIMWTESALECLPVSATSSVFSRDVHYTWMLFT